MLLSGSQLRGVAGCHSQYLTNMGARGTLTLALVVRTLDGGSEATRTSRLWGLCCCHDPAEKATPFLVRTAAEFLTQVFALQLSGARDANTRQRIDRTATIHVRPPTSPRLPPPNACHGAVCRSGSPRLSCPHARCVSAGARTAFGAGSPRRKSKL